MVTSQHVVGAVGDIPTRHGKCVVVGRREIAIFNVDGTYYCLSNRCPHSGGPLSLGKVTGTTYCDQNGTIHWTRDGEILRCPWHGWEFDLTTGMSLTEPGVRVARYPIRIDGDKIVVEVRQ